MGRDDSRQGWKPGAGPVPQNITDVENYEFELEHRAEAAKALREQAANLLEQAVALENPMPPLERKNSSARRR